MNLRTGYTILLVVCASLLSACGDSSGGDEIKDVAAYRDNSQCELPDFSRARADSNFTGPEDALNGMARAGGASGEPQSLGQIPDFELDLPDDLNLPELTEDELQQLFDDLLDDAQRDVNNHLQNVDLSAYEAEYEQARRQVDDAASLLTSLKASGSNIPYPAANFPDESWFDYPTIPNENITDRLRVRLHRQLQENSVTLGFAVTDELGLAMKDISPEQVLIEGFNALGEKVEEYNKFRFSNILAELASAQSEFVVSAVNDYSGSMAGELDEVEASLRGFYRIFPDQAQTEIIKFSGKTFITYPMAEAAGAKLRAAINRRPSLGLTAIYDAVTTGIVGLCRQPGYKALLLLTDGYDNDSSVTLDETIAFAKANRIPVFAIGFGYADKSLLQRITEETGGAYIYFPYEVYQEMQETKGQKPWNLAYSLMGNLYAYDYLLELTEVSAEVESIRLSVKTDADIKTMAIAL